MFGGPKRKGANKTKSNAHELSISNASKHMVDHIELAIIFIKVMWHDDDVALGKNIKSSMK